MRTLKKIAWNIGFNVGALYVVIAALEEVSYTGGWPFFVITGALIGFLNTFIKPILKFLSLPFIFVSAGLFLILINAGILWATDEILEILDFTNIDFQIEGTVNFLLATLIFGITNWLEHWLFKRVR